MRPVEPLRLFFVLALLAAPTLAEAPYHHVHLTATDAKAAGEWYSEHMGGTLVEEGRVAFGDVLVLFFVREAPFEGSAGSSVDHIGFSFPDLAAKLATLEAAGVKVTAPLRDVRGLFKLAFVEDPWGTKIEVMEDPDQTGFHHLHLRGPSPAEIFAWYQSTFGGELVKWKGMLDAIRYGSTWLLIQDSQGETMAPTRGRSIDHLGWSFPDLDATAVALKEQGVTFTLGPVPYRDIKIAFIEGPGGVRIELVESAP